MATGPAPKPEKVDVGPDLANDDWADLFSPRDLTEADWAEMDKLKDALATGGQDGFEDAFAELRARDSIVWFRIIRSLFPKLARKLWLKLD